MERCAMRNCTSTSAVAERTFFRFPRERVRSIKWVAATGFPSLGEKGATALNKSGYICDLHFEQKDIKRSYLKPSAVPVPWDTRPGSSLLTQRDADNQVLLNDAINNTPSTSKGSERKQTASVEEASADKTMQRRTDAPRQYKEFSIEMQVLVKLHLILKEFTGRKVSSEILKRFSFNLCVSRPITYRSISGMLGLPKENALRKCKIDIGTVFANVEECLTFKAKALNESDKYCTVCVGRMPLKRFLYYHINKDKVIGFCELNGLQKLEPATEVVVVLARGLSQKWVQPLAYCFLDKNQNDEIVDAWLQDIIIQTINIGFKVIALVTDHEYFYCSVRKRIVSIAQPYFILCGVKIYCIFDVPQLIKSLRNSLMDHDFEFKDADGSLLTANWEPIKALYLGFVESNNVCVVPKLTNSHVNPSQSEKKELKYAAQVFSKSVSHALDMEYRRKAEWRNPTVKGTQKLTALVNDAFDVLNSCSVKHLNKYKSAFTGESHQTKALREFMEFLTNVKISNRSVSNESDLQNAMNCIHGLRVSIMSIITILRDLKPKGIHSLLTQRFNLNAVDRFFGSVKRQANSQTVTPVQFYRAFRRQFMTELLRCPPTASSTDDLGQLLKSLDKKSLSSLVAPDKLLFQKMIEVNTTDYRFNYPDSKVFAYVCSYLLQKCYENHTCPDMSKYVHKNGKDIVTTSPLKYLEPPATFVAFMRGLDLAFNKKFGNNLELGLGTAALMDMQTMNFNFACKCFANPNSYLKRLFVRFRIFNIIRFNNRNFHDESFRFTKNDNYNDLFIRTS